MCQKLFLNVILVMECQKYEVGRNFWFWQKFLSFSLSTEHFAEKSRKMLKNSFFQIWRQSIVFAYFRKKLILKGVFCSKPWISRTQIQITFVKKILSWFLGNPPPKFDEKKFHVQNNNVVFLMCLMCAHTIFWFLSHNEPLTMLYTQLGNNSTLLKKVMDIFSQFFPKNEVKKWGN